MEWRGRDAPDLACSLQGIGLFDGMYEGLNIRNNLVVVSAYHGINAGGALDSVVVNNTIINRTKVGKKITLDTHFQSY